MAVTITEYDAFKASLMGGTTAGGTPIDYLSDTINFALVVNTYTPNLATHDFWDDVSAHELASGGGYTTGGGTLGTKAVAVAAGAANYDAADVVWTFTASKVFRYGVVYKSTGTASTSPLMFLVDFGVDRTEDSEFSVRWNATGIFQLT